MVFKPFVHCLDIVRDVLLVVQIGYFVQGGSPFLNMVFYSLLGCLILPFVLGVIRLFNTSSDVFAKDKWFYNLTALILTFPFVPIILLCFHSINNLKLKHGKLSKLTEYCYQYKFIKLQTSKFIRTELGLETLMQMSFTLMLLLYAKSQTRTQSGLEELFDKKEIFGIHPLVIATLGVLWGVTSTVRSYQYGIQCVKDHFPIISMIMVGIYAITTIIIKIGVIILFFTPSLGLFNLLRHYQGELYPYSIVMEQKINVFEDKMYYSNAEPIYWSNITRFDYSDFDHPKSPDISLYTGLSMGQYFMAFWIIALLHAILVIFVKKLTNPEVAREQSILDMIIHSMENTQIPAPMKDWDEGSGSIEEHRNRRKRVEIEMVVTILVNFVVHMVMLFPIDILARRVNARHEMLEETIGAFDKEIEAHQLINILRPLCFCLLILGTLIQVGLYFVYNRMFHPFKDILKKPHSKFGK